MASSIGPIHDDDVLRRRVPPVHQLADGKIASGAFRESTPNISVDLARLRSAAETLACAPGCILVEFEARLVRELGLDVVHKPEPENPAHCEVVGKINDRTSRVIRDRARRVAP